MPTITVFMLLFVSPVVVDTVGVMTSVDVSNSASIPSSLQGWLSGWEYRKSHTVEGSPGAGTDYQIRITVHYGSGTDTGENVSCDSLCRSDFSDIRFTDNDGTTLLDYWTESSVTTEQAVFWVEVAANLNTTHDIYVYYGNPEANTASNGSATFMLFDDFENGSFDAWDNVGSEVIIQSLVVKDGNSSAELPGFGGERYLSQNISRAYNGSFMVHTWINLDSSGDRSGYPVYWNGITATDEFHRGYSVFGHNTHWSHASNSVNPVYWPENDSFVSDTWYRIEVGFDLITSRQRAWNNRLFMGEMPLKPQLVDVNVTSIKNLTAAGGNNPGETMWVDNYYIRKWIPLEPSHSEWGAFESALSINAPVDLTYEAGTTGNSIEWEVSSEHPHMYAVIMDGALQENVTWDGSDINVPVDEMDPGTYDLTLLVSNVCGSTESDTVRVLVEDTTDPVLTHPEDVEYAEGETGSTIEWTMTDLYPERYEVHLDGDLETTGTWNSTGESVQVLVDGFPAGIYIFTLIAIDESGNLATDLVAVTVQSNYTVIIVSIIGVAAVVVVVVIGAIACRSRS
ncbi:MAG: DUF2341 domain-containing protein [Candidatus Thorarchaeota archaeon]